MNRRAILSALPVGAFAFAVPETLMQKKPSAIELLREEVNGEILVQRWRIPDGEMTEANFIWLLRHGASDDWSPDRVDMSFWQLEQYINNVAPERRYYVDDPEERLRLHEDYERDSMILQHAPGIKVEIQVDPNLFKDEIQVTWLK